MLPLELREGRGRYLARASNHTGSKYIIYCVTCDERHAGRQAGSADINGMCTSRLLLYIWVGTGRMDGWMGCRRPAAAGVHVAALAYCGVLGPTRFARCKPQSLPSSGHLPCIKLGMTRVILVQHRRAGGKTAAPLMDLRPYIDTDMPCKHVTLGRRAMNSTANSLSCSVDSPGAIAHATC